MNKNTHNVGRIYEYKDIFEELIKGISGKDIGIWYYDIINKRIIHGEHGENIKGFSNVIENVPQSLIALGYVHPDSVKDLIKIHETLSKGAERVEGDFWINPLKKNDFYCIHLTYTIISYENGKPSLAIGLSKNVTTEKVISKKISILDNDTYNNYIDYNKVSLEYFLKMLNENRTFAKRIITEAIENNEFEIYLQPKIDLNDRSVCGAESLIRWNHPKYGIISPNLFIESLESDKLIHLIDKFSICEVLKFQKKQLDNGDKVVPISCNLSAVTLSDDEVAEFINKELESMSLSREVLILEITETAFVDDDKIILDNINKLKNYGFKISMDDFGTGSSSLAKLANIPVDEIKLDMQMVRNAVSSKKGKVILVAVVQLAKALDLDVVAEGMETLEQVDFIKTTGCTVCQCYFFSKPLKINDFKGYIDNGSYREYYSCNIK